MENLAEEIKFSPEKEISPNELERYKAVQEIAKDTMNFLKIYISVGRSEKEIADIAEYYLEQKGINKFWYHGVGALVFVGERTTLSVSGSDYKPSDTKIKADDIVTVDLSPEIDGIWGDFARTFVVSNGKVVGTESKETEGSSVESIEGMRTEEMLHWKFRKFAKEGMNIDEAYAKINSLIEVLGFENLDFKKNLGHSIEKDPNDRVYIEAGNRKKFGDVGLFTFEPHIKKRDEKYGFKREDVYYFENGKLKVL